MYQEKRINGSLILSLSKFCLVLFHWQVILKLMGKRDKVIILFLSQMFLILDRFSFCETFEETLL